MKVTEYEIDQWITKYMYEQKSAINTVRVDAMEHEKNTIRKYMKLFLLNFSAT